MNGQRERLAKELEQLQKTYKAGIITDKEFARGKERIDAKIQELQEKAEKDREGRKIVKEILEPAIIDEPEVEQEEPEPIRPERVERKVQKIQKKKVVRQAKREEMPEEGESGFTKIIIFAGILFIILLIVLVKAFTPKPVETGQVNLTYNGTATMEFYFDATCPYSADAWQALLSLKERYGEHLSVKVKHFPMSDDALTVANAVQCARDQGKHLSYLQRLLDNQANITNNTLRTYAWSEGIDMVEFNPCVERLEHIDQVRENLEEGYTKGVRSSPTFFIDGEMVIGSRPVAYFQQRLDEKLAVKG